MKYTLVEYNSCPTRNPHVAKVSTLVYLNLSLCAEVKGRDDLRKLKGFGLESFHVHTLSSSLHSHISLTRCRA